MHLRAITALERPSLYLPPPRLVFPPELTRTSSDSFQRPRNLYYPPSNADRQPPKPPSTPAIAATAARRIKPAAVSPPRIPPRPLRVQQLSKTTAASDSSIRKEQRHAARRRELTARVLAGLRQKPALTLRDKVVGYNNPSPGGPSPRTRYSKEALPRKKERRGSVLRLGAPALSENSTLSTTVAAPSSLDVKSSMVATTVAAPSLSVVSADSRSMSRLVPQVRSLARRASAPSSLKAAVLLAAEPPADPVAPEAAQPHSASTIEAGPRPSSPPPEAEALPCRLLFSAEVAKDATQAILAASSALTRGFRSRPGLASLANMALYSSDAVPDRSGHDTTLGSTIQPPTSQLLRPPKTSPLARSRAAGFATRLVSATTGAASTPLSRIFPVGAVTANRSSLVAGLPCGFGTGTVRLGAKKGCRNLPLRSPTSTRLILDLQYQVSRATASPKRTRSDAADRQDGPGRAFALSKVSEAWTRTCNSMREPGRRACVTVVLPFNTATGRHTFRLTIFRATVPFLVDIRRFVNLKLRQREGGLTLIDARRAALDVRSAITRAAPGLPVRPQVGIDLVLPERPQPPAESEAEDDTCSSTDSDTDGSCSNSGTDTDSDADLDNDAWLAVKTEKARRLFREDPASRTAAIARLATELAAELADSKGVAKGAMATVVTVIEGGLASGALLPVDILTGSKNDYIKRKSALELSIQGRRQGRIKARAGRR